jgi:Phenylalanyl-tRNA synthetase beta subunit
LSAQGRLHPTSWLHEAPVDFYTLKGIVEHIGALYGVNFSFKKSTYDAMHPHQTADVYVEDTRIGMLGAVHPKTLKDYDLKHAYVAELSVSTLLSLTQDTAVYHPVSKMPSVTRDVAFITDQSLPASTLVAHIQKAPIAYLTGVEIFDVYTGEPLSENEKSIALSVTFNDEKGTFKTADIDAMMETLTQSLVRDLGIRVRE